MKTVESSPIIVFLDVVIAPKILVWIIDKLVPPARILTLVWRFLTCESDDNPLTVDWTFDIWAINCKSEEWLLECIPDIFTFNSVLILENLSFVN